jgi:methyl-accepting chemotaxis protein
VIRTSIHKKITLVIFTVVVVVLAAVYFFLRQELGGHVASWSQDYLRNQSLMFNTVLRRYDPDSDVVLLKGLIREWAEEGSMEISVIDLDGGIILDSALGDGSADGSAPNQMAYEEVQSALNTGIGVSQRFSLSYQRSMMYYANQTRWGQQPVVVRIGLPMSFIQNVEADLDQVILVAVAGGVVLSLLMGVMGSVFISRPIRDIAEMAKHMASGDLSKKITVSSNDEIADVAQAFNEMMDQMKSRIEEVVANKSRLEAVLSSMFGGLMVVDTHGTVLLINDTLHSLLSV